MGRLKMSFHVTNFSDRTFAQHFIGSHPSGLKSELVIDQRKHTGSLRRFRHLGGFELVHRHRLLAKDVFAMFDREHRHLVMEFWRRRDADKIYVITLDRLAPVVGKMSDAEFLSRRLSI